MSSSKTATSNALLVVDDYGHVLYNPSHLFAKEMASWEEVVERYVNLDVKLFYHVVSCKRPVNPPTRMGR